MAMKESPNTQSNHRTRMLLSSRQVMSDSVTPWNSAPQAPLSFAISQSLLKLMPIESAMPSNHVIICRPLLLPSVFPSFRVFSNESAMRWPKYRTRIFSYKYVWGEKSKNFWFLWACCLQTSKIRRFSC